MNECEFFVLKAKPRILDEISAEKSPAPDVCSLGTRVSPEYPNLECPPVFEPEVYSLKLDDESGGMNLLKRKGQINRSKEE